jgi:hypothetical protein
MTSLDSLYKYFYKNDKLYIPSDKVLYTELEKILKIKDIIPKIIQFLKPDLKKLKITDTRDITRKIPQHFLNEYTQLMTNRNLLYTYSTKYDCKLVLMHVIFYFMLLDKEILLTDTFRESNILNDSNDVVYFYHTASNYCISGYRLTSKLLHD